VVARKKHLEVMSQVKQFLNRLVNSHFSL
jgi:hypothetical protein